ncbi:hypothetical protein LY76DRAFT_517984 [Colletotrichum caudatum]|nr:hypothetical protein LY76DRAFT_517984 [Colletotrichum caudatum]
MRIPVPEADNSRQLPVSQPSLDIILAHPRLFARRKKWSELPRLIQKDPYLKAWNTSIFVLAVKLYTKPAVKYSIDGSLTGSGVLDVARELQLRIKNWAYAYRMSHDPMWKDRIWEELYVASGNSSHYFGAQGDNWNTAHWLDVGEFLVAFSYAYDWLYDVWSVEERNALMWSIVSLGLSKALEAYERHEWFLSTRSNWNCVTNGGMIIGALAVYHKDPTGVARQLLPLAINNARQYCAQAVESDGTWAETPDYWYFGTQAHAQLASALLTATGSTHQLLTASPGFQNTSLFHIYNYGMTEKFNYGDCGPGKLTATANALLFYGAEFGDPMPILYQRDRPRAADPLSILWYRPDVTGDWFHDLPLDRDFPDSAGAWVSMRSSWTNPEGLFVGMKAGRMIGHSSHGNLDAGDFVFDAMGERWAGELCQDDYLAEGYFSSEAQDSKRWDYYRCRTEGQNTMVLNGENQIADAEPWTLFETTETLLALHHLESTAYWFADMTSAYNGTTLQRGLRMLNERKQVLIQDEIGTTPFGCQWRMHTNASISYAKDQRTAHLKLNNKILDVVLQSPVNATFRTLKPISQGSSRSTVNVTDMPNTGVSVLAIEVPPGNSTVAVILSPRWREDWKFQLSKHVPLKEWTLTSHALPKS